LGNLSCKVLSARLAPKNRQDELDEACQGDCLGSQTTRQLQSTAMPTASDAL
jgi:hypothetical protein